MLGLLVVFCMYCGGGVKRVVLPCPSWLSGGGKGERRRNKGKREKAKNKKQQEASFKLSTPYVVEHAGCSVTDEIGDKDVID